MWKVQAYGRRTSKTNKPNQILDRTKQEARFNSVCLNYRKLPKSAYTNSLTI